MTLSMLAVQVVVGILEACEKRLLPMTDMEKMVDFLRGEVPRWPHDKLQVRSLIITVISVLYRLRLRQLEGLLAPSPLPMALDRPMLDMESGDSDIVAVMSLQRKAGLQCERTVK